jgi:hypothetical protein
MLFNEKIDPTLIDDTRVFFLKISNKSSWTSLSWFIFLIRQIFKTMLFTTIWNYFGRRIAVNIRSTTARVLKLLNNHIQSHNSSLLIILDSCFRLKIKFIKFVIFNLFLNCFLDKIIYWLVVLKYFLKIILFLIHNFSEVWA